MPVDKNEKKNNTFQTNKTNISALAVRIKALVVVVVFLFGFLRGWLRLLAPYDTKGIWFATCMFLYLHICKFCFNPFLTNNTVLVIFYKHIMHFKFYPLFYLVFIAFGTWTWCLCVCVWDKNCVNVCLYIAPYFGAAVCVCCFIKKIKKKQRNGFLSF